MATRPPENTRWRPSRRSSFARRDSNLALISAMLSGIVIAFALVLLLVQQVNPDQGQRIRGAAADLLNPVSSLLSAPVRWLGSGWDILSSYWNASQRVRELEAELQAARQRADQASALQADVRRLEGLLSARRPERRVVATASVSASPAAASSRSAILAAGISHGVRPRMPVIAADGLAGRVTDAGILASRMMLLTDPASRVPVKLIRTGWTGLAIGNGTHLLEFHFDAASGQDAIRPGDRLVTSGDGGLYPPNIAVGVIIAADRNPPLVRPSANPTGIQMAMVEAPWLQPPRIVPVDAAAAEADRPVGTSTGAAPGPTTGSAPAAQSAALPTPSRAAP